MKVAISTGGTAILLFFMLGFLILSGLGSWKFHVTSMVFMEVFIIFLSLAILYSVWVERKNKLFQTKKSTSAAASKELSLREREPTKDKLDPLDTFLESKAEGN